MSDSIDVTHLVEWDISTQDCDMCARRDREGWWGVGGMTHCRKCHRTWPMLTKQAHCTVCCAHFLSPTSFDLHLAPVKYQESCYPPSSIVNSKTGEKLLVQREDGIWVTPQKNGDWYSSDKENGSAESEIDS